MKTKTLKKSHTTAIANIPTDGFTSPELTPYFTSASNGIYYHTFVDKGGEITERKERLADQIKLIGCGIDDDGDYYRVIEWRDTLTKQWKTGAISMANIGANWGELQSKGITIQAGRSKRDKLADYLQTEGKKTEYRITHQTGWIDNYSAYVLPNGEILGETKKRVIFNGDASQAQFYTAQGTLADWRRDIASYANGNSRLMLALGASFASPLMRLLDVEGGGFHLFSDSSDGKTTAALAGLSVWGDAGGLKLTWNGTGHSIENYANARNDHLIMLDEINQADPRAIGNTIYGLANGTGRGQGKKEGGNRFMKRWRVMGLSTGEQTIATYIKRHHGAYMAGQAVRLPSIPADVGKGYGAFETIHDFSTSHELAEHLTTASQSTYGTAGRAFIEKLITDTNGAKSHTQALMAAFMALIPNVTSQARRVAMRFALVAGALELANEWGIMRFPAGSATTLIKQCFDDWLAREGTGKLENRQIIEQAIDFMQINAGGERFMAFSALHDKPNHFAGYFRDIVTDFDSYSHTEYWIVSKVFRDEIGAGFDDKKVCEVLSDIHWLLKREYTDKQGKVTIRYQKQKKGDGRFYVLVGRVPPSENESESDDNAESGKTAND